MSEIARLKGKIENLMVVNDSLIAENRKFDKTNILLEKRCESLDRVVHQGTLREVELKKRVEELTKEIEAINDVAWRGI